MNHKVFMSRRNIQTLLNKLDRVQAGESSACTIIKRDNQHAKYPQTMEACVITAVEVDNVSAPLPQSGQQIHLTRIDLKNLLNALNTKAGDMVLTCGEVGVYPLEDGEYYDTRFPGEVFHADDPGIKK